MTTSTASNSLNPSESAETATTPIAEIGSVASPGDRLAERSPVDVHAGLDARSVVLIDVREPDEHRREHIGGAINLPYEQVTPTSVDVALAGRSRGHAVLHCQSGVRSLQAASALIDAGFGGVTHMPGGLRSWKDAGLPTRVNRGAPIGVLRQVQLTIGACVLLCTLLGAFLNAWFLVVPAFMGAGLVFAGATGRCGLAVVLARMPWNRLRGASCVAA